MADSVRTPGGIQPYLTPPKVPSETAWPGNNNSKRPTEEDDQLSGEAQNLDELIADMKAFDQEGQQFMTPVAYAKIRPVYAPQVYGWIKNGTLTKHICQCGRMVIDVEETDEVLRQKGKLPKLREDKDAKR